MSRSAKKTRPTVEPLTTSAAEVVTRFLRVVPDEELPVIPHAEIEAEHLAAPEAAVEVPRINLVRSRAKPIKVERRDGTIAEVDVETVVEGCPAKPGQVLGDR